MSQTYLMIENPGVAPPEAFTLLGATTKRGSQNQLTVGSFGSGNKHGCAVCIRHEIAPTVFCGSLRLEFGTRQIEMEGTKFDRVQVKFGGKDKQGVNRSGTEDLGFVLDYGATDWATIDLALREFVSNALDRAVQEADVLFACDYLKKHNIIPDTASESDRQQAHLALVEYRQSAKYAPWDKVVIEVVEAKRVRAKADHTRVFIPLNAEVFNFYENLGKWFLHFSEPELLKQTILPKANRNLTDRRSAVIYRRGVRVREVLSSSLPSLFDYNLEVKLDESRQVDDYVVKNAATQAIANGDIQSLSKLFMSFDECESSKEGLPNPKYWEHQFDAYALYEQFTPDELKKTRRETWSKAARHVYGETMIAATDTQIDMAGRKGHKAKKIPFNYAMACETYTERQTVYQSLSLDDREGREVTPPMKDATVVTNMVWECLTAFDMTKGKEPPKVFCFRQLVESEAILLGFRRGDSIYLNSSICSEVGDARFFSELLIETAIEEISHYVTEASDCSRDFQTFAFTLAAKLVKFRIGV